MTNFIDIIKNESSADADDFVIWKFPTEDFNTNAQLIVGESEQALFVSDGVVVQVFEAGRYTLSTKNYPFIATFLSKFTGDVRAFQSKVYFVSLDHKLETLWGTDTPIQLRDPVLRIQTSIQARGSFAFEVQESKKLFLKLAGSNTESLTRDELTSYFRSAFLEKIKDSIASFIQESGREVLDICASREVVAQSISEKVSGLLDEYGVRLVNFYVSGMDIPANDPNRQKLEEAFANKSVMGILGDDWARQQSVDIMKDLAGNEGGGLAALGASAGLGFAMAGPIAGMAGNLGDLNKAETSAGNAFCTNCGTALAADQKFCGKCGKQVG